MSKNFHKKYKTPTPSFFWSAVFFVVLLFAVHIGTGYAEDAVTQISNDRLNVNRFEDGDYLFDLKLEKEVIGASLFTYVQDKTLFLSLTDLSATLQFPIDILADEGLAEGWFMSENRKFFLDLNARTLTANGKSFNVDDNNTYRTEEDIYLSAQLIEQVFPIVFEVNAARLSINITPTEILPQMALAERQKRHRNLKSQRRSDPSMPLIDPAFKVLSMPSVNVDLTQSFFSNNESRDGALLTRYTALGHGDLLYGTGRIYVAGDENDSLRDLRLSVEHVDAEGGLLNPLNLTRYAAGDVSSVRMPIISDGGQERGIVLQKNNQRGSSTVNTQDFVGDATPGWEIELYRNGVLLEFRDVGIDGKYEFLNVPLIFGRNNFELVFYGPQGQKTSQKKSFYFGPGVVRKGQLNYEISATEQERTLFDFADDTAPDPDQGNAHINALATYGLTDTASMSFGTSAQSLDGENKNYFFSGISGGFAKMFATLNLSMDENGGYALESTFNKRWKDTTLRLESIRTQNFETRLYGRTPLSIENRTKLNLGTRDTFENNAGLYTNTSLTYDTLVNNDTQIRATNSMSLSLEKMDINNSLTGFYSTVTGQKETLSGLLQLNLNKIKNTTIKPRLRLEYSALPDTEIRSFSFSNTFPLSDKMSLTTSARKNFGSFGDLETVSAGLVYNNGKFHLIPQMTLNSEGDFSMQVGMRFSVLPDTHYGDIYRADPFAQQSHLSALAFHDINRDGIFDPETESPVEDLDILSVHTGQTMQTDENGIALIPNLIANRRTDIMLDEDTLLDPSLSNTVPGYGLQTRPGKTWRVEFPLVTVGEIDGSVLRNELSGDNVGYANAKVTLYASNGDIIDETRAAYDGFYLFEKVIPGTYVILTQKNTRASFRRFVPPLARVVIVPEDGDIQSGIDFYFIEREEKLPLSEERPKEIVLTPEEVSMIITQGVQPNRIDLPWQKKAPVVIPVTDQPKANAPTDLTPADKTATPTAVPKPTPAAVPPITSYKGYHLASHATENEAKAYWQELAGILPDIFSQYDARFERTSVKGKTYWRTIALPKEPETNKNFLCKALGKMYIYCKPMRMFQNTPPKTAKKKTGFHLASNSDRKSAQKEWDELISVYSDVLAGFQPVFQNATVNGKAFIRTVAIKAGHKTNICPILKSRLQYCKRLDLRE